MKLCIVTHRVLKGDGQGRVNYEVAQEAIRRGHHITLLATDLALELQQHSQIDWIPISVRRLPLELLRNLMFSLQSGTWLRQHRHNFDLIKVNGAITWVPGDVNAAHFVHSDWLRSPVHTWKLCRNLYSAYQWLYTALNARWEKRAFNQAEVVVAVSEQARQALTAINIPKGNIRVILNGVDLDEFSPGQTDRQQWKLPTGVPLALFVGDIQTPRKNLDAVLHALTQVPELHLGVLGETVGSPYPELAAKLDLSQRVHFLGQRTDVAKIMQASDFLVFPSRYETFGLVVIEAMAAGLPVITATTTGAAELVTPNCGIVLTDPNDTQALARAIGKLANDRQLRQQMGKAARCIAEHYSWANTARSYVDLFEELKQS